MNNRRVDVIIASVFWVICFYVCIIGGLFHPDTIAGSIARWFWSVSK